MKIDLKSIAYLSRLHFTEKELAVLEPQVLGILALADELKKVDVTGVEPTDHPFGLENAFREDVVILSTVVDSVKKYAPATRFNFFKVPKVIEDKP